MKTKKGNVFTKSHGGAHNKDFAYASCILIIALFLPWFTISTGSLGSAIGSYGGSSATAAMGILNFEYTPLAFFGLTGSINGIIQSTLTTLSSYNMGEYNALQGASGTLTATGVITLILWIASLVLLAADAFYRFKNKGGTIIPYIVMGVFAILAIIFGFAVDGGISSMMSQSSGGIVSGGGMFGTTFWPWVIAIASIALIYFQLKKA